MQINKLAIKFNRGNRLKISLKCPLVQWGVFDHSSSIDVTWWIFRIFSKNEMPVMIEREYDWRIFNEGTDCRVVKIEGTVKEYKDT